MDSERLRELKEMEKTRELLKGKWAGLDPLENYILAYFVNRDDCVILCDLKCINSLFHKHEFYRKFYGNTFGCKWWIADPSERYWFSSHHENLFFKIVEQGNSKLLSGMDSIIINLSKHASPVLPYALGKTPIRNTLNIYRKLSYFMENGFSYPSRDYEPDIMWKIEELSEDAMSCRIQFEDHRFFDLSLRKLRIGTPCPPDDQSS